MSTHRSNTRKRPVSLAAGVVLGLLAGLLAGVLAGAVGGLFAGIGAVAALAARVIELDKAAAAGRAGAVDDAHLHGASSCSVRAAARSS